jgi:hypothetical protein
MPAVAHTRRGRRDLCRGHPQRGSGFRSPMLAVGLIPHEGTKATSTRSTRPSSHSHQTIALEIRQRTALHCMQLIAPHAAPIPTRSIKAPLDSAPRPSPTIDPNCRNSAPREPEAWLPATPAVGMASPRSRPHHPSTAPTPSLVHHRNEGGGDTPKQWGRHPDSGAQHPQSTESRAPEARTAQSTEKAPNLTEYRHPDHAGYRLEDRQSHETLGPQHNQRSHRTSHPGCQFGPKRPKYWGPRFARKGPECRYHLSPTCAAMSALRPTSGVGWSSGIGPFHSVGRCAPAATVPGGLRPGWAAKTRGMPKCPNPALGPPQHHKPYSRTTQWVLWYC